MTTPNNEELRLALIPILDNYGDATAELMGPILATVDSWAATIRAEAVSLAISPESFVRTGYRAALEDAAKEAEDEASKNVGHSRTAVERAADRIRALGVSAQKQETGHE